MSTFDDPNREAVGLAPIWSGSGEPPPPEGEPEADAETSEDSLTASKTARKPAKR